MPPNKYMQTDRQIATRFVDRWCEALDGYKNAKDIDNIYCIYAYRM